MQAENLDTFSNFPHTFPSLLLVQMGKKMPHNIQHLEIYLSNAAGKLCGIIMGETHKLNILGEPHSHCHSLIIVVVVVVLLVIITPMIRSPLAVPLLLIPKTRSFYYLAAERVGEEEEERIMQYLPVKWDFSEEIEKGKNRMSSYHFRFGWLVD